MKQLQGSIYYDKSRKSYRAMYTDQYGERVTKRFKDEAKAKAWLVEMQHSENSGLYVKRNDITVGEWVIQYIELFVKPNVREKTYYSYLDVSAHTDAIAPMLLQKITAVDVQQFIVMLDASMSMKGRVVALLRRASKKAYQLNMIKRNFMDGVEAPKVEKNMVEIFEPAELQKILEYLRGNKLNIKMHYPIVLTAILTGCRMGEILGLREEDLETDAINVRRSATEVKGTAKVNTPKTFAGLRRVTVNPNLILLLRETVKAGGINDGFVFHNKNGKLFRTTNMDKFWKGLLERLGIRYRNFHCIRHTHATYLLSSGVQIMEVAKRLGHSRPSHTLNLYGHAVPGFDKSIPNVAEKTLGVCPILPSPVE